MTVAADDPRWAALAAAFPADQIEKLPKVLKREDQDKGRCERGTRYSTDSYFCGKYHARAVHLDYVGHAGITMRLNLVDPLWTWEPMALGDNGLPLFTPDGLWIRLTVLEVSRLGFGDAGIKRGPDAIKEIIGDALRNAAMRFGVGTYLWSKSTYAESLASGEDLQPEVNKHEPPHPASGARMELFAVVSGKLPDKTREQVMIEITNSAAALNPPADLRKADDVRRLIEAWKA